LLEFVEEAADDGVEFKDEIAMRTGRKFS